jgi:3',5'-cyclic AMP phosphodiesterase CpdA
LLAHVTQKGVDHVVVTGDITADARPKEYEAARQLFLSYGFLNSGRMTIVPGNHDVYGGVHTAEEIFVFPKRCKTTNYDDKLKLFRQSFHEAFEKTALGGSNKMYPLFKPLGDIVLVGINSVAPYSRLANPIGSNGAVVDKQFSDLEALLNAHLIKHKRKIVLVHHHFSKNESGSAGAIHNLWSSIEKQTMKLKGKKRLLKLFRRTRVELVLHGHVHENCEYTRDGIRFANTGASVLGRDPHLVSFRLIRVCDTSVQTTLHTFRTDTQSPERVVLMDRLLVPLEQSAA